jgi:hypothetical protein
MTLSSGRQLWEFPVAVWQLRGRPIPIGGGGYWRFLPNPLLLRALRDVGRPGAYPALYFHPYECDPLPLRAELPPSRSAGQHLRAKGRSLYRNPGRRRVPDQIRRVSQEFALVPHEAVLDQLARGDARARTLSPQGVLV